MQPRLADEFGKCCRGGRRSVQIDPNPLQSRVGNKPDEVHPLAFVEATERMQLSLIHI